MKPKHLLTLVVLLGGVTAAASLLAAQKPAPPQPTEQQKLKERVDALESQLREAQAKADRAAMEKDYIERIQKESKDYYEKVLATQTWTLTIVGLVLTAVFGLTARFGFGIFDRRIQDSLRDASTQLRTEFNQRLDVRFQQLEKANAAQMNQLEESLVGRIKRLEEDSKERSMFQFQFAQALACDADERYQDGRDAYRFAIKIYKRARTRELISKNAGAVALQNLFFSFFEEDKPNHLENANTELTDTLYDDLEEELALASVQIPWLAHLIRDRKAAVSQPATIAAVPAPAQKSPEPAPDKTQPAKQEQGKNK